MSVEIQKPQPLKIVTYDWHEINSYLKQKYPTWKENADDIWYLLCDNVGFHNGSTEGIWPETFEDFMDLWEDDNDTEEAWVSRLNQIQLCGYYLWKEFGEKDSDGLPFNERIEVQFIW